MSELLTVHFLQLLAPELSQALFPQLSHYCPSNRPHAPVVPHWDSLILSDLGVHDHHACQSFNFTFIYKYLMDFGDFSKHRDPTGVCWSWCPKSLIQKWAPITYLINNSSMDQMDRNTDLNITYLFGSLLISEVLPWPSYLKCIPSQPFLSSFLYFSP